MVEIAVAGGGGDDAIGTLGVLSGEASKVQRQSRRRGVFWWPQIFEGRSAALASSNSDEVAAAREKKRAGKRTRDSSR